MCTICRTGSPSDGKECKVPGMILLQKSRGQPRGWTLGGNEHWAGCAIMCRSASVCGVTVAHGLLAK